MVLNEPESSLRPSVMGALARLLVDSSRSCQIVVVSHNEALVGAIRTEGGAEEIRLEKSWGETIAPHLDARRWVWPKR